MAQATRSTGKVRWFNDTKGFGFISPDEGGEDLFVHQSDIKCDGYRTLPEKATVEYTFAAGDNGRPKAVDVTAPNGAPISSRRPPSFGGGWRSSPGGNNSSSAGGGCYQCGGPHFARDCPGSAPSGGGNGGGGGCYNCGQHGHFARECRNSGAGGACYTCGERGHMARDCNRDASGSFGGRYGGAGGGGGGGGGCYNCGEPGHFARECTNRG